MNMNGGNGSYQNVPRNRLNIIFQSRKQMLQFIA